jgi:hypothetical protein
MVFVDFMAFVPKNVPFVPKFVFKNGTWVLRMIVNGLRGF